MLAALLVLIITAAASPAALLYVAPPLLAGGGVGLARVGGEPLALAALRRARWRYASSRDWTRYRVAVVAEHSPAWRLPGVLAPLALLDAEDGYGGRYGLVLDRRTGMMTATLRVIPASTWLADRADADTLGGELGRLARQPRLPARGAVGDGHHRHRPRTGLDAGRLGGRRARPGRAADRPADHGPARRRRPGRRRRRGHPGQHHLRPGRRTVGARRADRVPPPRSAGRCTGWNRRWAPAGSPCWAGPPRPRSPAWSAPPIDPAARGEVNRLLAQAGDGRPVPGLSWAEAGPVGAEEEPGCYRHDSGISISWSWSEAPRQNVTADVLARLVAPGRYPKRVSLQYRPFSAAEATRVLEAEVNAAQFRSVYKRRTGRDETARDSSRPGPRPAGRRRGGRRRRGLPGLDCTSPSPSPTPASCRAPPPRPRPPPSPPSIRLRRMTYSQAAGWAATLPVGICPAELARRMPH